MRPSFITSGALLVLSLLSCTVSEDRSRGIRVVLRAETSKTAFVNAGGASSNCWTPVWTKGDALGVFAENGDGQIIAGNLKTDALSSSGESASFGLTLPEEAAGQTLDFYAYYPHSAVQGLTRDSVLIDIPAVQIPANGSFDPLADVLSAYPVSGVIDAGAESEELSLRFCRRTAVIRLDPDYPRAIFEDVSPDTYIRSVKVTFDRPVAGTALLGITSADNVRICANGSCSVLLKYTYGTHRISDPVWLCIAPADSVRKMSFDFHLTDTTFVHGEASLPKPVSFGPGRMFSIDVPITVQNGWKRVYENKGYFLVKGAPADWSGKYLITGSSGRYESYVFDGSLTTFDVKDNYREAELSEGRIPADMSACEVTVRKSGDSYTVRGSGGKYLGGGASSIVASDDPVPLAIGFDSFEIGNDTYGPSARITDSDGGQLIYYSQGSVARFRFYRSGASKTYVKPVNLYRYSESRRETEASDSIRLNHTATLLLGPGKLYANSGECLADDKGNNWYLSGAPFSWQETYQCQLFGTSTRLFNGSFSMDLDGDYTVTSVKVCAGAASEGSTKLSVKVGGTPFKSDGADTVLVPCIKGGNRIWYTFTGRASGQTVIRMKGVSGASGFGGVEVRYEDGLTVPHYNVKPGCLLAGYEIPAVKVTLPDTALCHGFVKETFGDTYAYEFFPDDTKETQRIVTHTFSHEGREKRNYTVLYDRTKYCSLWVAYCRGASDYPDNGISRDGSDCKYDPAIPQDWQPSPGAYRDAGASRIDWGHQCPAANCATTEDEVKQSFYMSNGTPQYAGLNRGYWKSLEGTVRGLGYACSPGDTLYIVTGPLFGEGFITHKDGAGQKDCAVPTHYWKCVLKGTFDELGRMVSAKGSGFLFEHKDSSVTYTLKTIDQIEALCGFDLYHNVPDSIQRVVEANITQISDF